FRRHSVQRGRAPDLPGGVAIIDKLLRQLIARADLATGGIAALAKVPRRSQVSVFFERRRSWQQQAKCLQFLSFARSSSSFSVSVWSCSTLKCCGMSAAIKAQYFEGDCSRMAIMAVAPCACQSS